MSITCDVVCGVGDEIPLTSCVLVSILLDSFAEIVVCFTFDTDAPAGELIIVVSSNELLIGVNVVALLRTGWVSVAMLPDISMFYGIKVLLYYQHQQAVIL